MEYRVEIIDDRKGIMDWFDTVEDLLIKTGTHAMGKSTGAGFDVYLYIEDMNEWLQRAIGAYGNVSFREDTGNEGHMMVILGYDII